MPVFFEFVVCFGRGLFFNEYYFGSDSLLKAMVL